METNTAPTSAAAVANAFLDIQRTDNSAFQRIDQMKLYKLVYYAHAWWLAQHDQPLFDEDVSAWPWGPVVQDIYGDFRSAGRGLITHQRAIRPVSNGSWFKMAEPEQPSEKVMPFLQHIWEIHKPFNGIALSNATHAIGEPWTIVKDLHQGDLSSKPTIPNEVIRDVFKRKIARNVAQV